MILIPVQIKKKDSKDGQQFWISSDENQAQGNKILAEKLRREYSIILSEYIEQNLQVYFEEIAKQKPKNMTCWQIRRWATIGVFPSASLAIYHDLDPNKWDFGSHKVISNLFRGSDIVHNTSFCEEYDVDEPEIENKVLYLIDKADASQFSTIVDAVDGKNLTVEGPPGTGKSQTIVNTIAASLDLGKKVLFIAEKSAALEVVRSKLEAFGIGNFLLPLQVKHSNKKQVFSSIRERMQMRPCANPSELDNAVNRFKEARQKLKSYIDILSANYEKTDFTIYNILGYSIKFADLINSFSENIRKFKIPDTKETTSDKLQNILEHCKQVEEAWSNTSKHPDYWKVIKLANINPFQADELLYLAAESSKLLTDAIKQRQRLTQFKLSCITNRKKLENIKIILSNAPKSISNEEASFVAKLTSSTIIENIKNCLDDAQLWRKDKEHIMGHLNVEIDFTALDKLLKIKELLLKYDLDSLKEKNLESFIMRHERDLNNNKQAKKSMINHYVINHSKP